ncbi:MAG: hypothetical protein Q4E36_02320 [Bacillota bacterium]|nr:hypothetical protein [Bacillota bacterium]
MTDNISNRKIQEVLLLSHRTLIHLNSALKEIDSAGNWGAFNNLTGGLLSSFTKNDFIEDVLDELFRAKEEAGSLRANLEDLQFYMDLASIDQFLSFSSGFFDDYLSQFLADLDLDQAQINIKRAIGEVEALQMAFGPYVNKKLY